MSLPLSQAIYYGCAACIIAAAVRLIFPSSGLKAVINTVLLLYILSTALRGLNNFIIPFQKSLPAAAPESTEAEAYLRALYLEELGRQLQQAAGLSSPVTITEYGVCFAPTGAAEALRRAGWLGEIQEAAP